MEPLPEKLRAAAFLHSRLSAETNLEVWRGIAPTTAPLPLISFDLRPKPDRRVKTGTAQTLFDATVRVMYKPETDSTGRVIRSAMEVVEPHLQEIKRALDSAADEGISCRRSGPFSAPGVYIGGEEQRTEQEGYNFEIQIT